MQIPTGTDTDLLQQTGTESSLTARADHRRQPRITARIMEQPAAGHTGSPLYSPAARFLTVRHPEKTLSVPFLRDFLPPNFRIAPNVYYAKYIIDSKTAYLLAFLRFCKYAVCVLLRFVPEYCDLLRFVKHFSAPIFNYFRRRFRDNRPGSHRHISVQAVPGCFLRPAWRRLRFPVCPGSRNGFSTRRFPRLD